MSIDVKTIICPQCGSSDVNMLSEARGLCQVCGTQFAVQQHIETQNVYNEIYINTEKEEDARDNICNKAEILPEYSTDDFIRKAWIQLAREDAPLEVFEGDFTDTCEKEHQVLIDSLSVDVTYQASIGYDREEPYIAYEDYWEDEPYIATESYYDQNTRTTRTRQVTKYKKVKKQRQVTKYKKVTDWSPLKGNHQTKSVALVENVKGQYLDQRLFVESFRGTKDESVVTASAELSARMEITAESEESALAIHRTEIGYAVKRALPGDHSKDLDWKVSQITESSSSLYKASEYETSICFGGKTYVKRAFPFGPMQIGGDQIENEVSLDAVTHKMRNTFQNREKERKDKIEENVANATNKISFISIGLLAASILVSLLIRSTALVIIMFALAVIGFVFNTKMVKKEDREETKRANDEIEAMRSQMEDEVANYAKNYKSKQRKALDDKLKSLGYKPATANEL